MSSNKGGVAFAVIVIMLVSASFAYVLTSPTGGGLQSAKTSKYTQYVNLGADAAGWEYNYNTSNRNAVLNIGANTLVYFNVTEEDGAPHNLYLAYDGAYSTALFTKLVTAQKSNPKSIEGSSNFKVLSVSQITQTIGHSTQGQFAFGSNSSYGGIYTYWCSIHYETMVGLLIVNATSANTSAVVTPLAASSSVQFGNLPLIYSTSGFNGATALNTIEAVE